MGCFDQVCFRGTFRDYQLRVLDNTHEYLRDGHINIVAAPGSGKTVLGLELIRRVGAPCLILSPTIAIRQQWGERFRDLFLNDPQDFDALFSDDLHTLRTVNCATYQALYSAMEKAAAEDGEPDFSNVDLIAAMRSAGIGTLCLDEAHHLRNDWYRALASFLQALGREVTVISLTATPPYDADGPEWRRYQAICGEIDEEIFVPELVAQRTLCPHQDFVLFNTPTQRELETLRDHRLRCAAALEEVGSLDLLAEVYCTLRDSEPLSGAPGEDAALLAMLDHFGYAFDRKRIRALTGRGTLPKYQLPAAEAALQYLLDGDLLSEPRKAELAAVLKRHGVYEKKTVSLVLTERMKRLLICSAGKLESIARIAQSETASMGERLRMLILTDYIQKEHLSGITARETLSSISVVSIFETLRRADLRVPIGVLSGSLVILPNWIDLTGREHTAEAIDGTEYCAVSFTGTGHSAVEIVGSLLESGVIRILIGTKSLLGEGWDSPCVNTLILASVVGSFVQSNQMRGRAIRVDPGDPQKAANIWHLATVTPEFLFEDSLLEGQADPNLLSSYDFSVLVRRFDGFMGPNQTTGEIESGFERLTAIHPPFDRTGVERINRDMLALSAQRDTVRAKWHNALAVRPVRTELETRVSTEKRLPVFTVGNVAPCAVLGAATLGLIRPLTIAFRQGSSGLRFGLIGVLCACLYGLYHGGRFLLRHRSPTRSIQALGTAVYQALCQSEQISPTAELEADSDPDFVTLRLHNASVHDQNIFNTAIAELLSPIDNPRYLLIARNGLGRFRYEYAFACPSALGKSRKTAELLAACLKRHTGRFTPVYTRTQDGRQILRKCRKRSYLSPLEQPTEKKYRVAGSP